MNRTIKQLDKQMFLAWHDEPSVGMVDRTNPDCPFHQVIGQDQAVRRLSRVAFESLGNKHHQPQQRRILLTGPRSCGKRTLAKLFAKTIGLPFVSIGSSVRSVNDLLVEVAVVCENTIVPITGSDELCSLELVPMRRNRDGAEVIVVPSLIVYVDEVASLSEDVLQAVLQASQDDPEDIVTEKDFMVEFFKVCCVLSSSDPLIVADHRFESFTKLRFSPLSKEELFHVIKNNHGDIPNDVCRQIAQQAKTPREAEALVRELRIETEMNPGASWLEALQAVRSDCAI